MRWMTALSEEPKKTVVPIQEPIELLLYLARKSSQSQNDLKVTVVMKPFDGQRLLSAPTFKPRCEKLLTELRAYLIAK
jgi:hypothetical protein